MTKFSRIKIPTYLDSRGSLSAIELKDHVDFEVKRIYYVTGVTADRGGHCVKGERKLYVMMKGSCTARVYDGVSWAELQLQGPEDALLFNADLWREFVNFSGDAVLAAISNINYDKNLYITDLKEFEKYTNG